MRRGDEVDRQRAVGPRTGNGRDRRDMLLDDRGERGRRPVPQEPRPTADLERPPVRQERSRLPRPRARHKRVLAAAHDHGRHVHTGEYLVDAVLKAAADGRHDPGWSREHEVAQVLEPDRRPLGGYVRPEAQQLAGE